MTRCDTIISTSIIETNINNISTFVCRPFLVLLVPFVSGLYLSFRFGYKESTAGFVFESHLMRSIGRQRPASSPVGTASIRLDCVGGCRMLVLPLLLWGISVSDSFTPRQSPARRSFGDSLHHNRLGGRSFSLLAATREAETTNTTAAIVDSLSSPQKSYFFAKTAAATATPRDVSRQQSPAEAATKTTQSRPLGSQELLMLPRQYGPSSETFAPMNHVMVATLSKTPPLGVLRRAIGAVQQAHPLLRARVQGSGEPAKRIDLFQMVREGEPDPLVFVVDDNDKDDDNEEDDDMSDMSKILKLVTVPSVDSLEASWKQVFGRDLDCGDWCDTDKGPLWKLELHTTDVDENMSTDAPCAMVFSFNHAISDQSSANRILHQLLELIASVEGNTSVMPKHQEMPLTLEESVLGRGQQWSKAGINNGVSRGTLSYVAGKAAEGLKSPVILPDQDQQRLLSSSNNPLFGSLAIISGQAAGGVDDDTDKRQSTVQFRSLSQETTTAFVEACRAQGVAVTHALAAAATLTASDFIGNNERGSSTKGRKRNYKVLESLDMRRFGAKLDGGETVACMAGSMDLMLDSIADNTGERIRRDPNQQHLDKFWKLAKEGKRQTAAFIDADGPENAVRVFDFAMTISDLTNLVHLSSKSKSTQGRAYSAGITNVGVYERQEAFQLEGESGRSLLMTQHGNYRVRDIYFATPHTQSGCLYPVSGMTVNGELKLTFHAVSPMVDAATNALFADAFGDLVETVSTGKRVMPGLNADVSTGSFRNDNALRVPDNLLVTIAAVVGAAAVATHGRAWIDFFQTLMAMKANTADPSEFWAALNFWIFFAVGHPLLQPILWISEVLHGTPGPQIGGLLPVLFATGNVAVLWAIAASKQVRDAINISLVAAFFAYVGAGLDGQAGLGDFNLALDDSYQGKVVRGCPSYEEVRQPSMDNFNLKKYQGLWYEAKFHDWTQFKEVYDTTLNIRLTDQGKGWIDDFGVSGPAPDAAPLSWDKSPVANGAHYFLFGRVDPGDPPGILREKGFGVEFPNYIVDVQTDPKTGEYKEAIQFQCLERGGVRVFEGINFMSRKPVMTENELADMHERAERAGMYPYGASPEQMHTVAHKMDDTPIDNNWQAMWRAIGLDKLLELLTESIEDGGR